MSPTRRIHSFLFRRVTPILLTKNPTFSKPIVRSVARSVTRSVATASEPTAPPKPSLLRRAFAQTLRALFFTTLGFTMAAAPAYTTVSGYVTPKSDEETTALWTPSNDKEQAHEDFLNAHPLVHTMRANPAFSERRPHLRIPAAWRAHNLTAGTLMRPDCVPFPPVGWLDAAGPEKDYVQISYVGAELCGHPGIVHGGYLATVLDEGLAWPAFAALPHGVGMTANLNVNYKAPCMAGQYIVLRGKLTKAEGRKAWVEARIETLPEGDEKPVVLVEATALYVEPKQAAALSRNYSAS
ncbi:unnamed protein product [Discula destructiva]